MPCCPRKDEQGILLSLPLFYSERARKPRSFEGGDEWPYLIWSLGWVWPLDEQPYGGQV